MSFMLVYTNRAFKDIQRLDQKLKNGIGNRIEKSFILSVSPRLERSGREVNKTISHRGRRATEILIFKSKQSLDLELPADKE